MIFVYKKIFFLTFVVLMGLQEGLFFFMETIAYYFVFYFAYYKLKGDFHF